MTKHSNGFDCENLDRRKLIQRFGFAAAAALTAGLAPKSLAAFAGSAMPAGGGGKVFPPSTINHLSLAVADYAKSRDWYVDLFGMRPVWDDGKMCALEFGSMTMPNGIYIRPAGPNEKVGVGHFALGFPNFMAIKADMKAEMERRGLQKIRPDGEVGWIANDPAGYMLNTGVPVKDKAMYPGAAGPCEVAASEKCKAGWEAGMKNLSAVPKASGKGFKATSYSHIVLNVPEADIPEEREFYTGMFGMKVIYANDKGPNANHDVFLRFGRNTLYLRKTAKPDDKPYCNHYAFVIENFDRAKVKAELDRRGLNPQPDSKLGWTVHDPDGMRIEVAAWGLPEHIANDCDGANTRCPGGVGG